MGNIDVKDGYGKFRHGVLIRRMMARKDLFGHMEVAVSKIAPKINISSHF